MSTVYAVYAMFDDGREGLQSLHSTENGAREASAEVLKLSPGCSAVIVIPMTVRK